MKKNSLRDIRQQEFADLWIEKGMFGILHLAPRFGKCYVAINVMEKLKPSSVLIAYPDKKIKQSWEDDLEKRGYDKVGIAFTTHRSLHKHQDEKFDLVIIDEIHLLSEAQISVCEVIFKANKRVLGLSGTLSHWTQKVLREDLKLRVVGNYSIEMAIEEGIIPDYEINVIAVPLDNRVMKRYKNKLKTEKRRFDGLMWNINREKKEEEPSFFLRLKIIEVLQNSVSKLNKTKELIRKFKDERLLVFCGRTDISDNLGIPSYHSKSEDKQLWNDFIEGKIKHMAVVKIGNTGITYLPLNKVIINSFDSNSENLTQKINRCMSLEYNNPNKKAIIYIITSNENIELRWLNKALGMFNEEKIKYL